MSPRTAGPTAVLRESYRVNAGLTIIEQGKSLVNDPSGLALEALAWILADGVRAHRFLDLTGLSPDGLRDTVTRASTHRAVLEFLCAHEPDLIAASEALEVTPQQLVSARDRIAA